MWIILAAMLLAEAPPVQPVPMHDGGACVGLAWVALTPGETGTLQYGPDFLVRTFHGPGGTSDHLWSVYSGNFASAQGQGAPILESNGVIVRKAYDHGRFDGYLAEKDRDQAHFFGPLFTGDDSDKAFFKRVDFADKARALCGQR